jgi:branched-chain amino acid transport system substrate-binding protein
MLRRCSAAIAVALVACGLTACGGDSSGSSGGSGTLKIGVINPFSGDFALYGEEVTRGYQLAVDAVNAKGGVSGRKIQLVRGDASSADDAISQVDRLATRDNVELFTGTYISAVANTASDTAARYKKLYWETNAIANELTTRKLDNFLRVGPRASDFADVSVAGLAPVAKALAKPESSLRVYLEHEDSIYGTSVAQRQAEQLKAAGVQVVGVGKHAAAATDVTESILKAKQARPDVWISTGYVPDTNLLLRTAAAQGFHPPVRMLVGTGDTKETLESVGAAPLNGTVVVSYPSASISDAYGPGSSGFLAAYRKAYGSDPRAPQSLTAYAGMQTLLKLVADNGGKTDVGALRAAALKLDRPEGSLATGYGVKFDASGQNERAKPVITQWRGSKPVTVYPAKAAGTNRLEGLGA